MATQHPLFHGIVTAMVTPLTDQQTLDREGLSRLIEHLIAGGVHGVFPLGTTGEAPALPTEMQEEVIELTCEQVAGRVPVIVGVTNNSLIEAVRLTHVAAQSGATAIAAAPPFYYALSQDEILRYYEKLVAQTRLPLVLYNAPANTHDTLHVDTVRRASQFANIIGLKDSGFDMDYFREVKNAVSSRADFSLLVGPEELLAECIQCGGHGSMAAGSNIFPSLFVSLYEAAVAKDSLRIARLHKEILDFGRAVYHGRNPLRGLKCGLRALGVCSNVLSEPLSEYTLEETSAVEQYVREHCASVSA